MCEPTTLAYVAVAVVSTASSIYQANETGKKQANAINEQNAIKQDEIAKAAGQELSARARAARRERASMRAAGSEAGVNLGSGSFLAALQTSVLNQYNDQGLIIQNEKAAQRARDAETRSQLAGIQLPTALGAALQIGAAGFGAYNAAARTGDKGAKKGASG